MAVADQPPSDPPTRSSSTSSSRRPRRRRRGQATRPARRRPPEVLTETQTIALIKACSARAPTGIRTGADRGSVALGSADLRGVGARAARRRAPRRARSGCSTAKATAHGRSASTSRQPRFLPAGLTAAGVSPWCQGAGVLHSLGRSGRHQLCPPPAPRLARKGGIERRVHAHGLGLRDVEGADPDLAQRAVGVDARVDELDLVADQGRERRTAEGGNTPAVEFADCVGVAVASRS